MFSEHYVYFMDSKSHAGPFFTFEAAFSHLVRYQKDARIETADGTILATWSVWTGLFKLNAKYKFLVVDNDFNREHHPMLVGQTLDIPPKSAIVQDIEVAA